VVGSTNKNGEAQEDETAEPALVQAQRRHAEMEASNRGNYVHPHGYPILAGVAMKSIGGQ
jgi:hypothetical protein